MTETPQCNRMTVRQDTDNNNNNIQIYKMDNEQNSTNTIYKIDNLVCTGILGANVKCNEYVCYINKYMIVLCVLCLLLSV